MRDGHRSQFSPLSVGQPGEKLFEFVVGHDRYLFELRDHGEQLGAECQVFKNEELWNSRRFDPRSTRPARRAS